MNKIKKITEDSETLKDLLNEIYFFVAMKHRACDPWREALDSWQERVENVTKWKAFNQIEKFNKSKRA